MKAKIEIGTRINKGGIEGTITKIITKSTGYVEVTFDNGKVKKEMAFNLNTIDGDKLKATPVRKPTSQAILDRICNNKKIRTIFLRKTDLSRIAMK